MQMITSRRRGGLCGSSNLRRRYVRLAAAILASLFTAPGAMAETELWGTGYDGLLDRPGVTLSTRTQDDGSEDRYFKLPGGVEIIETRTAGKVSSIGVDNSGHGAVLCSWELYIGLSALVEICPALHTKTTRTRYLDALPRINRFIHDNMLEPVPLEQVEDAAAERRKAAIGLYESYPDPNAFCSGSEYAKFVEAFGELPDEDFRAAVDKLLSVPRLPVKGPCF